MKTVRYVKQSNLKDCASSCIYNIIRFYKGNINYNSITKRLNITSKGSSIYNIIKTLKYYGLDSDAYECSYDVLKSLKCPLIAYLKINNYYHYIIIKRIKNNKIYIFDPIRGDLSYSKELFLKEWTNIIIKINKVNKLNKEESSYKKYLFNIIKRNKLLLFLILIVALFYTITTLLSTYIIKFIIDEFDFYKIIILIILFEIFKNILSFIYGKIMIKANMKLNSEIRNNIYNKIFNLPNNRETKTFNIIYRISDLTSISDFIFNFPGLLIDFLYIIIIFLYFIYIGFLYPYILLLLIVISLSYYLLIRKRIINLFDTERNNYTYLNTNLIEKINLLPTIIKLKAQTHFINSEVNNYNNYLSSQKKLNNNMLYYNLILNVIFMIISSIIILISFRYNSLKLISLGDFYINYMLFSMYTSSLENILNFDKLFLSSKNAFKRIVDLFSYDFSDEGKSDNRFLFNKNTFIYSNKYININNNYAVNNSERLMIDTIDNNIIFKRNISINELNKVKRVCHINGNTLLEDNVLDSLREKIILARTLLSDNKIIILNNLFRDINPIEERIIIKNIITEYNKTIILISNRKDNFDLFDNLVRIKGGKCEKVRCL